MSAKERKARKQYKNKFTVVGILERDGKVRAAHVEKNEAPGFGFISNTCLVS